MGPRRQGDRRGESRWAEFERAARGRQQVMLDRERESEGEVGRTRGDWQGPKGLWAAGGRWCLTVGESEGEGVAWPDPGYPDEWSGGRVG